MCGSVAAFSVSLVLITALTFRDMFTRKLFTHTIIWICITNLCADIVIAFADPVGDLCVFQGASIYFFKRSCWFWTLALNYNLYCLIVYGAPALGVLPMHVLIWSVSLGLEFLPYVSGGFVYGSDDTVNHREGTQPCNLRNTTLYSVWVAITFVFPLLFSLLLMMYYSIRVWLRYKTTVLKPLVKSACMSLFYYPLALLIADIPYLIAFFVNFLHDQGYSVTDRISALSNASLAWSSIFGVLTTVIFDSKVC